MEFTYTDDPANNVGDAIRFMIGDTDKDESSQNISDGELAFLLARYGFADIYTSYDSVTDAGKLLQVAVEAGRALVAKYAKEATYAMGGMSETTNQKGVELRKRVRELEKLVARTTRPRFLGQSESKKSGDRQRTDLVQSFFQKGMFDNTRLDTL